MTSGNAALLATLLSTIPVLAPSGALACCRPEPSLSVAPYTETLPADGILIVEGDGYLARTVRELDSQEPILRNQHDEVPLEVIATHISESGVTQTVLRPKRPLVVGRRYELNLRKPIAGPAALNLVRWNSRLRRNVPVSWRSTRPVGKRIDWISAPEGRGMQPRTTSAGTYTWHEFSISTSARNDSTWVLVEVEAPKWLKGARHIATARDGKVFVGRGACGGPFDLRSGTRYSLRFSLVDTAGNVTPAPGDALTIIGTR